MADLGKVGFFGVAAESAFDNLKLFVADKKKDAAAAALFQHSVDVVKNVSKGAVDLSKVLEGTFDQKWRGQMGEEHGFLVPLQAVWLGVSFLERGGVESLGSLLAVTGESTGTFVAVAAAAAKDSAAFTKNFEEALKATWVIGAANGKETNFQEAWSAAGVTLPAAADLRVAVLGPDGRGDLRAASSLVAELASVASHSDYESNNDMLAKQTEIRAKIKTVEDYGCPVTAQSHGKVALPIDGIRDEASLNYALPDIAAIKAEIKKRGYSFDVSLPLSFAWLAHDLAVNAAVAFVCLLALPYFSDFTKWTVLWPIYSIVMGTTLTGLWVIGHECGHRAFAGTGAFDWVNDVVGFVTHTPLLVPFWAWRYSHHKHHMFTNHLLDGESHVPSHKNGTKLDMGFFKTLGEDAFVFWNIFQHLVLGWPLYLIQNATGGRRNPANGKKLNRKLPLSHFKPSSQVFDDNQRNMILPGTFGCLAWLAVLAYVDYEHGLGTTLFWFWGAYIVTNGWLVLYTWLHHSDHKIPHFSDGHFSYMRGATCSVDRNYPAIINYVHHHIGSTHVMHHISFQVPHYRAEDATKVFRERWPHLYRHDTRPLMETLFDVARNCHYVEDVQGVQYYKHLDSLKQEKKKN